MRRTHRSSTFIFTLARYDYLLGLRAISKTWLERVDRQLVRHIALTIRIVTVDCWQQESFSATTGDGHRVPYEGWQDNTLIGHIEQLDLRGENTDKRRLVAEARPARPRPSRLQSPHGECGVGAPAAAADKLFATSCPPPYHSSALDPGPMIAVPSVHKLFRGRQEYGLLP
ncbi:hypothetical protein CcaverHIS002_0300970 [Cutaneotrichosporon cavernicola]|uniref:Uncharacterized protein n=1 Tax=Cutaneotrichosporon cavernicola TaxID=279322 RepID=A0AA48I2J4_9TREE|nr:uncharacterized protein CcaverHIS019_0300940 [Cutaneotrichosporon cavernicola]BEI82229.1 hypothetical protein CcaverHIS002_0300970 [Cutaneotrichosporon cavernicola]BEI90024.1 hypothetical protein CcaverHIS019_0300940 [Cutaneotrichosporon cavernicola]BEI97798.1 hypothetical protein CcaverHIS631_0300970 [Cutaneotrichosporon cavernicola]BEJ05575.1 hypothetical protein CcaverHIS641_0300970 [Cutaneotrichosporon cavernicola]